MPSDTDRPYKETQQYYPPALILLLLRSYTGLIDRKTNLFRSMPPNNQTIIPIISLAWLITLRGVKFTLHMEGNDIPLQAWTDPEGSRIMRLPAFKIIGT